MTGDKHSNLSPRIKIRRVYFNVVKFKTKKKIDLWKTINLHPNSIDAQECGLSIILYLYSVFLLLLNKVCQKKTVFLILIALMFI